MNITRPIPRRLALASRSLTRTSEIERAQLANAEQQRPPLYCGQQLETVWHSGGVGKHDDAFEHDDKHAQVEISHASPKLTLPASTTPCNIVTTALIN